MAQRGKGMLLGDLTGVIQPSRELPPESLIGELVMNSIEAPNRDGKVEIDIYPVESDGRMVTVVLDSGHGMSRPDVEHCFKGLGYSRKKLGGTDGHMGWGPKPLAYLHSRSKIEWVSWKNPDDVYATALGEHDEGWGPLEINGEYVRHVNLPRDARDLKGKRLTSGTMVTCYGLRFVQKDALRFLNTRYFDPRFPIRVWRARGDGLVYDEVLGYKGAMDKLAESSNCVELPHVTVYWWVLREKEERDESRELKSIEARQFTPMGLAKVLASGKTGMLLTCKWQRRPTNEMVSWSIPYGQDRICLALVAKGENVRPSSNRFDIDGWEEERARSEWRRHLSYRDGNGMPHEDVAGLVACLEEAESIKRAHVPWRTLVDNIHAMIRSSAVEGLNGRHLEGIVVGSSGQYKRGKRGTGSGGGSGGAKSHSSSRSQSGRFEAEPFDNDRELDGKVAEVRGNKILFNPKHPLIKRETDKEKNVREKEIILACFAVELESLANDCLSRKKRVPNDDELDLSAGSNVLARLRSNTDGRLIFPLEKISVSQKPKKK